MTRYITLFISSAIFLASCNNNLPNETEDKTSTDSTIVEAAQEPELDLESEVLKIDEKRLEIESMVIEPVEITTESMREKVKQKWSKIHFYAENGEVVKIKTYPHESITKRTEEFYADNSGLILVVIEDDGEGAKGKSKDQLDKMYYFHNNELIRELRNNQEAEFNKRNSDAEELQTEFSEYLQLYRDLTP